MTLILISSKLVDIPQNTNLSRNFSYVILLKPHFCTSGSSKFATFLQNNSSEGHLWRAVSEQLHYKRKHIYF